MDFHISWHLYRQKYRYKYLALYHALRDSIVNGTIPQGTRLPASRELADLYEVSRGVVSQVYEMLTAEGYLTSEVGRGTFVSFNYLEHQETTETVAPVTLSTWGRRVAPLVMTFPDPAQARELPPARFDLSYGSPDLHQFPFAEWNRLLYAAVRESADVVRERVPAQGYLPLREGLARHLRKARGIDAHPDDIVIVNGSMQAIGLLVHLLVDPGDPVAVENPGYLGSRRAIRAVGGVPVPATVDEQGLIPEDWEARLLFVTPSRQYPTGAVLSLERRQELLRWAMRRQAVIVEDDYDSEFRRKGRPIEPLKVLDGGGRVAYVGTFSKTLLSDLRVGYVVLPPALREPFAKARQLFEPHPTSLIQQRAIALFLNSGQYERHLRRMKRLYARKHRLFFGLLQEHLGDLFDFAESDAGLDVFGRWKRSAEEYRVFLDDCQQAGIRWSDETPLYLVDPEPSACFGFSHLSEEELVECVLEMAAIWQKTKNPAC
jgi:GntR family transcriptional regulator / MocR family aminotransferase